MARKATKQAAQPAQSTDAALDDDTVFAAASQDLAIVRAAGITNGMAPEEVRARILAVAAAQSPA